MRADYWFAAFVGSFFGIGCVEGARGHWGLMLFAWGLSLGTFVIYCIWLNKDA
jgi:hypothetical protein